jgi:acetyl-CoA synthetase
MSRRILTRSPWDPDAPDWAACRAAFRWDLPRVLNIAERCCDSWAAVAPDRVALTDLDAAEHQRDWTYGDLRDASDRFAVALRALGVRRGDRIAILLPQGPATLIAHFAAYKLGCIALPLFTLFREDALAYRLRDSGAKVMVTNPEKLAEVEALADSLPALKLIYTTGPALAPVRSFWADIGAAATDRFRPVVTGQDDPAIIIYTSGTTGDPKGVLHGHRFLLGHLPSIEVCHPGFDAPGAVAWTPADWAWIGGLMDLAMPALYYGTRLVSHRMRKFDPEAAWDLIRTEGASALFLPPTALKLLRAAPLPVGLAVRSVSSGGEALGADLLAWGRETLGAPIHEIYGQTECNLVVNAVSQGMTAPPGAMGLPVPGHDVQVQTADGAECAPGETGEIVVRRGTPVMFLEYWKKPGKTAEKFRGDWMRTGDLAVRDAEGYLRFASRDDDVITSAGYRIGPTEIETCLTGHPDVVMAAAVGIPDPVRTEVVKAFVVLRDRAAWEGLEDALIARVRERVSPHVAPRSVERIEAMPMTATGKILRRALRDRG